MDKDGHSCECAVVANDDWQHLGLGRILVTYCLNLNPQMPAGEGCLAR